MLHASLAEPSHWKALLRQEVFQKSLAWITARSGTFVEGIQELGEPGWYVNVHGYTTQSREDGTWENHRQTIDLQYLITGEEMIDVLDRRLLGDPTSFKPESDTEKFADVAHPFTSLLLRENDFAIFFPGEAHRPKVAVARPSPLRKLVVKIPLSLILPG